MIDAKDVTACLVTRGNVRLTHQTKGMPNFAEVLVWDNSMRIDLKVFGRYEVTKYVNTDWVAWVDDDVEFEHWEELLDLAEPDTFTANNAHGPNHGGYNDLVLQAAGAVIPTAMIMETWDRWFDVYPLVDGAETPVSFEDGTPISLTDGVLWEADFIHGVLCPRWKQVDLPYTRLYADDNSRLCRQPWQEDLKLYMTNLARAVRDGR